MRTRNLFKNEEKVTEEKQVNRLARGLKFIAVGAGIVGVAYIMGGAKGLNVGRKIGYKIGFRDGQVLVADSIVESVIKYHEEIKASKGD